MSPPDVWGPPVWTLFHTIAAKINPNAYASLIPSTFAMIQQICKYLPCPECSHDATAFLRKIDLKKYKTKHDFKVLIYLFHNYVNAKKRKPLFDFSHLSKYDRLSMNLVVHQFIQKYHTKGNMKLLTESFQRSFVIKHFLQWYKTNYLAFVQFLPMNPSPKKPEPVPEEQEPVPEELEAPVPEELEAPVPEEPEPVPEELEAPVPEEPVPKELETPESEVYIQEEGEKESEEGEKTNMSPIQEASEEDEL